jgi:protein SCO1/2
MRRMIVLAIIFTATVVHAGDPQSGKNLFVQRACNSCHSIGSDGTALTGPNLTGVMQRRDKAWLTKWLKNPDAMRTDPIIQKMNGTYPAPMPNLGLTDSDVSDLLAYLASASTAKK